MFRLLLPLFLFLSCKVSAQDKLDGFGALSIGETTINEARDFVSGSTQKNYGEYYGFDEKPGDTNLVEMNGFYDEFGICVDLSFFHDTLYKIYVGTSCYVDYDLTKKRDDTGDFFQAFLMKFGMGKVAVKRKDVLCKCRYCERPTTFYDYDSIMTWQVGTIHSKMEFQLQHFYADGGCQSPYNRTLVMEDIATTARTKRYIRALEAKERDIHNDKTKELYKKL